jgi:hypothetical protein
MAAKGQRSYTLSDAELMAVGCHDIGPVGTAPDR